MADDRAEEIFEAITTRNSVLLDDVLKKMTSTERANVLTSDQYGSGEVLDEDSEEDEDGTESLLVTAVRNGDLDSVKILLKYKADVEVREKYQRDNWSSITRASLFWAADFGYIDILRCLIENGVDINSFSADNCNCTPLMKAVENGDKDVVTFLIDHGANVTIKDKCGYTALHRACIIYHDCSPEVLSCLIENGADVNLSTDKNRTPLMTACEYGHVNTVTILIEHGANVNLQDRDGLTAVHYAVRGSQACEILSCLMENGADVDAKTFDDCTPLMIAAERGDTKVATFLIEHGANVDLPDKIGATALCYALKCPGNLCEVGSCLIENGADINACINYNCCTPLMMACEKTVNDQLNALTFLIEHGAIVNLQDIHGSTALHYVVQENSGFHEPYEVLDYLIQNGADINAQSNHGRTPLMRAIDLSEEDTASFLIKQGANLDLQDKNGDTAFHYAVHSDSPEITDSILTLGASCMCNNRGLTPLLVASSIGKSEVVVDFIKRPEVTKEQRIEALELLGASVITSSSDFQLEMGFKYIKRGMEERFANPSQPLVKPSMEPVEAYQKRKESQTLEELALIEDDFDALLMESLNIRERILGKENAELLYQIRDVASFYLMNDDLSTCIRLRRHAIKIAQSSNVSSACDLCFISDNLFERNRHPQQKEVIELLEQTVLEYKKQNTGKIRRNTYDLEDLFLCLKNLISIISINGFCGESNTSHASILLRELCRQDPRDRFGHTLLHFVVWYHIIDNSFPLLDVLKLLLNVGFDVNAVNGNGDTPLHSAVTKQNKFCLLTGVMETLFNGGAHHDFVNNDGKTPMDMAKTDVAAMILSEKRKLELKCISARAVKKFGIPYLGVVPKTLEKYVSMH